MLFNSLDYLIFFPIVTAGYFFVPRKVKNLWLLAASYFYYMCWNARYALLMLTSTAITYLSGILLERVKKSGASGDEKKVSLRKKLIVFGSFASNLGILFYFKYANFVFNCLAQLAGSLHIQWNAPVVDVLLPVGISFYTFQALSYTMDVYRDDIYAEKNFFEYALFVSFFPQLVAGPIERSKNLLKQLSCVRKFSFDRFREGLLLMLWGYFLKLVLADRIAIFVDTVYGSYTDYPGAYLVVATILFAVQIYCDFAGYSTIAMGAAGILGIRLMENFDAPYLSGTVAEFWRRWHISLTSWFKDYLYIPLGGSRKGPLRKYLNKMIVFLVSGLWHGARFSFIVWGGLNGAYQVLGEATQKTRDKLADRLRLRRDTHAHKILRIVFTFVLVDFSWIFFRSNGIREAFRIIRSIFTVWNPWVLFDGSIFRCGLSISSFWLMMFGIGVLLAADIGKRRGRKLREAILMQNIWARWLIIIGAICFIVVFGIWGPGYDQANFIYFQF